MIVQNATSSVGDGSRVSFWRDKWCESWVYKSLFLRHLSWLEIKRLRWWRCGNLLGLKGSGALVS